MSGVAEAFRLPADASIGRVGLRVRDLEVSLGFYRDVLGLEDRGLGIGAVGLGAPGGETVLHLAADPATAPRPANVRGLFHVALLLPDRAALGAALARLLDAEYALQGFADHDVSEAIYLADPDGNGLEVYADRPRDTWQRAGGSIYMTTRELDVRGLLAERDASGRATMPAATRVGHIHLQVGELRTAEPFYSGLLGLDVVNRGFPGALFLSAGGYHHHVGLNTWGRPAPEPAGVAGLFEFEVRVPDVHSRRVLADRLHGHGAVTDSTGLRVEDPEGNRIVITE